MRAGRDFEVPAGVLFTRMIAKERLDELLSYDPGTGLFTWRVYRNHSVREGTTAGTPSSSGHTLICIDRKLYLAHRLAFLAVVGSFPPNEVDHINGDPSDNRWSNLRRATHAENGRNQRISTRNTSGVTGVSWHARGRKWCAQISGGGAPSHLGLFTEFEDAVAARRAAEVKYFGEFSATLSRPAA